ncbi:MAG: response regulator [Chromatiaceae bacterium]|nr:response regulator [Chromatiaceae bacterium]
MTRGDVEQTFAVLFVDDEEKAQKYFRMAYTNDFPVLTASSVEEALDVLGQQAQEIGVLITDQRMPGQQGVDLLKRARDDWPWIVRILTTAYSDLDDAIAAVNRGEILRYITKPWDIQALRIDLRHAMDFFLLRRERDLLLAEKFSVRQRMAQCDRLVGLLAIAAGFERLRHAPYAIAAWARNAHASESNGQPVVADLELWGREVRETLNLMQVHQSLRVLNNSVEPGFPDRADLAELLRGAGLAVKGRASEVIVRRGLIEPLFEALVQLAGNPASACLQDDSAADPTAALTVTITGPGVPTSPFAGGLVADSSGTGLLGSYLIAWHHGGTLETTIAEGESRFVLTLPKEPDSVVLPKLDEAALAGLFSFLEDWQ